MPVVCVCGTVADASDVDCALCGRDLSSLRSKAHLELSSNDPTHQADVLGGPSGISLVGGQQDHSYGYVSDSPAAWQPPADGWFTPPQADPGSAVGMPATSRSGMIAVIILGAFVLVIAGFALGYFVIAEVLPG